MTPEFAVLPLEGIEADQEPVSYQRMLVTRAEWRESGNDMSILSFADGTLGVVAHPMDETEFSPERIEEVYLRASRTMFLMHAPVGGHA